MSAGSAADRLAKFKHKHMDEQGVAEGGPFSYGKPPRKGSVAANAEQKRKEQDRKTPPIEPKDQRVGNAKITKGVAEGMNDTVYPNAQVIKSKNSKPVGEIYQDANGWGCFHYRADRGYDGIDSREDAIAALKDLHQEIGRSRPDYTIKGVAEGELTEASVKHVMGRYQVVHNGKVVGTYNAKYEAQDRANHLNDTAKRMPRGNYSDEANPIRDDGNEPPDYAAMYENKLVEFAGGMGTGSVATAPGVGKGSNVGSLFGGSYSQKNSPFKKTKAKKESVIKR